MPNRASIAAAFLLVASVHAGSALAQTCPGENDAQHFTGAGNVACACFVAGEEAGATFDLPGDVFPIEIIRVRIGWGSQFGGQGQTLEQAFKIYQGGLPDPGAPIFTLPGPVLTDGAINEFDLDPLDVFVNGGPVTVTLEFANDNVNDPFQPTVVHDGNGCQGGGRNIIKAIPGGWQDVCTLGLSGDWLIAITYRCEETVEVTEVISASATRVSFARPNPFASSSEIGFSLESDTRARLVVYDVTGRALQTLASGHFSAGPHTATWNGADTSGRPVPPGVYFVELQTPAASHTAKVVRRD